MVNLDVDSEAGEASSAANQSNGPNGSNGPGEAMKQVMARTPLERHLLALVDASPSMIYLKDTEFRYLYVNEVFLRSGPVTRERVIGRNDHELLGTAAAEKIHEGEARVLASGRAAEFEEDIEIAGATRHYLALKFPAYDESGALVGIGGVVTDITARRRREAALVAEQQRVIDSQRDTLRELSTPLLPIAPGVLAMPLIGTLGPRRSQELLDTLLHGITAQRARIAILDVTGIRELDVDVAAALVSAARAARLVGAAVVLTGISPAVAQTLVALGTDLAGITTLATLADGIAFALRR